jgi:nucleotide-binding universal stress UspA family protein
MTRQRTFALHEILAPTDFSEHSRQAFEAALSLAQHFHARLHVFHVMRDVSEQNDSEVQVEAWTKPVEGVEIVKAASVGAAASEIVAYAQRQNIDLIVMGTHGRSGLARMLLGSVAEAVVRDAPCQVLTIGPKVHAVEEPAVSVQAAPPAPPATPRIMRCLVCGKPSQITICESCKAYIQGEAIERKRREEQAGRR